MDKNEIIKKWNHLWSLHYQQGNWRVYKYVRKDSSILHKRFAIDESLAKELIDALNLVENKSVIWKNRSNWRRLSDWEKLNTN